MAVPRKNLAASLSTNFEPADAPCASALLTWPYMTAAEFSPQLASTEPSLHPDIL
jgi:hypothetical protein